MVPAISLTAPKGASPLGEGPAEQDHRRLPSLLPSSRSSQPSLPIPTLVVVADRKVADASRKQSLSRADAKCCLLAACAWQMLITALLGWSAACLHVYPVALEILQLLTAFFFPVNCPKSTGESISNLSYHTFAIACPRRVGNENLICAYGGGSAFKPHLAEADQPSLGNTK